MREPVLHAVEAGRLAAALDEQEAALGVVLNALIVPRTGDLRRRAAVEGGDSQAVAVEHERQANVRPDHQSALCRVRRVVRR